MLIKFNLQPIKRRRIREQVCELGYKIRLNLFVMHYLFFISFTICSFLLSGCHEDFITRKRTPYPACRACQHHASMQGWRHLMKGGFKAWKRTLASWRVFTSISTPRFTSLGWQHEELNLFKAFNNAIQRKEHLKVQGQCQMMIKILWGFNKEETEDYLAFPSKIQE